MAEPVSRASSHLWAWAGLALVNAFLLALTMSQATPIGVRLLAHLYDAGQLLAAGLALSAVTEAWQRWLPGRARSAWSLACAVAAISGAVVLEEDLGGVAAALVGEERSVAFAGPLGALLGLAAPLAHALGGRLARPMVRWGAVALALVAAAANALVLERLYLGLHLLVTVCAASLLAGALVGARPRGALARWHGRSRHGSRALLAGLACYTLVVRPPSPVAATLLSLPSAALAPYVAVAQSKLRPDDPLATVAGAWFSDRSSLPDAPASEPRLLGEEPIVILLVVDCMRADLLAEKHAAALPGLHRLQRESVVFEHAWAPGPATAPSVTAMFAGRYYSQLYWAPKPGAGKPCPHLDTHPRFPELLSAAGVQTVGVASMAVLTNEFGMVKGFGEELRHKKKEAPADWIADSAIELLARHAKGPLFVHGHFMEAHAPYNLGPKSGSQFERYLGEVRIVDGAIERLLEAVRNGPHASRTAVIVTADHGEAFGEHNTTRHATTLYEELIHVPLLVRLPGAKAARVTAPVTLVDLGPTILDVFGQPTPASFLGQSLTPHLRGETEPLARPIASESGRFMRALLFPDGKKLIQDKRRGVVEMYDLNVDRGELDNLFDESSPDSRERLGMLEAFFAAHLFRREGYEPPYRR